MWAKFSEAMLNGEKERAKKVYAKMTGADKVAARRWLYGPNAEEKRESRGRQTAIRGVTKKETRVHCQFYTPGGLV